MRTTAFVAAFVLGLGSTAAAVDLTTCGQTVPRGEVGVLVADLDCPVAGGVGQPANVAVLLESRASLDLGGFTLSGADIGVQCFGKCAILGPGTVSGFAIGVVGGTRTRVENVVFLGTGQSALQGYRLDVFDTDVIGDGGTAILAVVLRAERVHVDQCWYGITVLGRARARDLTVTDSGQRGISGKRIRGNGVTVTGSGDAGMHVGRILLVDSTVTGNGTLGSGIDIRSGRRPRLKNTVCDRSEDEATGLPFGVCGND